MKRIVFLMAVGMLSIAMFGSVAMAGGHEWHEGEAPHGHVMLQNFDMQIVDIGGSDFVALSFDRCVEFAAGEALRGPAHHHSVHAGTAGGSPFVQGALWNAGHVVVPLAPYVPFPWTGCESFTSPLLLPAD